MVDPRKADWDVVIVGGGIAGASLGAQIAGKRRTLIIEAESLCGYHATGRSAAFWLESYGGPLVAPLTSASRPFLADPPRNFADHGFLRTRGALHLDPDDWPEAPAGVAVRRVGRAELETLVPGIRPRWRYGLLEPGCADIDVAALHSAYLRQFRRAEGSVATSASLSTAIYDREMWTIVLNDQSTMTASLIVNAAGAWADPVAMACGVAPLGIAPKRRTMVQLAVGATGLRDLPLIDDTAGTFYFKGEGDRSIWLSPHDEIASDPCDAGPDEVDVAIAIDRFQQVVDWPLERIEHRWAGLRSFARDRLPVYGFDTAASTFFWCVGQGGFGIQTSPAASWLAASILLGETPAAEIAKVDPRAFSPARFR